TDLYQDLLGRTPDTGGLTDNVRGLDGIRQIARFGVAAGFVTSVENRSNLIAGYYTTFLRRPAGPGEVQIWLPVLQGGGTPAPVLAGIVASEEDFQKAGGTNAAWLDRLLRRPPRPRPHARGPGPP